MAETTPIIGRNISRYRILEEVGRGGMATVYRALDTTLAREVAVKVLHPHLAGEAESRSRLEREAQAVAKLRHDNILEIHDYSGSASEAAESYIVTEFIRGPTLTAFLGKHRVTVPEVAAMVVHELAAALETAHRHGVIHRDIKPENVMIRTEDGRVKLTDFGIAQIIDKERLTATGQLIGSPAYLAPELVEGGRVDFRTDVFSLGIVLYRVATGQLPFQGRNPHEMMKRIVECKYPPPDQVNPAVGRGLQRVMARAMARRPDDRHQDMEALRRELAADLTAAGIDDVRAELGRYFADPDGWEKAARPRLTAALVASARREKSRSAALALVGRALALSPADAAAKALLERMGRTRRRGTVVMAVVGAAAVIAGGAAAVRYRATHGPRVSPTVAPAPEVKPASLLQPAVATVPPRVPATQPAAAPDPRLRASPSKPPRSTSAPGLREVAVQVWPFSATIYVDDTRPPGWREGDKTIRVTPGVAHRVKFSVPVPAGMEPLFHEEHRVLRPQDTSISPVRLAWKDAQILVKTKPQVTHVSIKPSHGALQPVPVVNGKPEPLPVKIWGDAVTSDGYETVQIEVHEPGFEPVNRYPVKVRAGQLRVTEIPLKLTAAQKTP